MYNRLNKKTIDYLFSLSHVVGLGYGIKETGGKQTGRKAVIVMVRKKVAASRLAAHQMIPKRIEGMPSDVIEVGWVTAHPAAIKKNEPVSKSRTSRWRPAPGGVSIGHFRITAGTLGSAVYDKATGRKLILSNNHVLANATNGKDDLAEIGDPVLQPGPADGGTIRRDTIGKLYRFVPLADKGSNVVDAAVARPSKQRLVDRDILRIGTVTSTVLPRLGLRIKKSGRTTGLTFGRIIAVDAVVDVDYGDKILRFKNQIVSRSFEQPGDSGSLVVDRRNRAVGLVFAGSDEFTFMNPIRPALRLLKITF